MPRDSFVVGAHDLIVLVLGVASLGVNALFAWLAPWSRRDRRTAR